MDEAKNFVEVWGDGYLAGDLAEKLTCIEVEALASVLLSLGAADAATKWIEYHAEADDCGDQHCRCDDEECKAEREG
ncbi:hypothetical protein SEA_BUZZBUZZ_77 [Mycobacterium phage BuzzBuzz]|uniref:Uncharacterized protein n=5 Tax=Mycobacterium phage Bxz2 TaxID=205870 RepID=A0A1B1SF84_BPMB2|nr:hypothetical protein PBI_BXZ2_78 [Mycobacterium phage Bxz2]ANU79411.1 hypothetical protein SEA_BUZZBUZZ_77 [Mycobacterium phage BuzzBuzz]AOZ64851.1 hypothetical protein SEA_LOUIE6_82 [Mycobacterium phage Louie6]ASM62497.1 hypothetical protein SEA_KADY_80 [Mycobacterium phage KADY]QAY17517.1 hypothetical protein SEA_DAISHI_82 [Mycobacterium phage Daishi]AAN01832.1 hypothetical protein PBI_BXZ2_78 [Mycobacterium phage Bxz2]